MAAPSITLGSPLQIAGAIRQAAHTTGVSFEYLLTTARIESNLNPAAKAATSSAKGLYQFVEQTWLATVKAAGSAFGLGRYSNAITVGADGRYDVADPKMRDAIMQLRGNPTTSAMMAGAFTRSNAAQLKEAIGRAPSEGELYLAHFLGSDGASKLIATAARQPRANAAAMFPQAAAANPSIFYDQAGRARSASDVYARLTGRFEVARAASFAPAGATATATAAALPSPDMAGIAQAFAQANDNLPPLPDTKPLFQAMFTDRRRLGGVTEAVSNLWASAKTDAPAASTAPTASAPQQAPLDLFTDSPADIRKLFRGSV